MRIGIMGGSFDPIHFGHLLAGQQVLESHSLDKVVFMPAGRPVLKQDKEMASAEDRYAMCVLACAGNPRFEVSRIEIERQEVTYTIDTMQELHKLYPQAEFFFILGTDAMASFPKWRGSAQILELCSLVEVSRSKLDISSTEIRKKLAQGKSVEYLVHSGVADYIRARRLYAGVLVKLKEKLAMELSRPRYLHSLSVMETAVKLARHYGMDEGMVEKARIAGLMHDCAKHICDELRFDELNEICGNSLDLFFKNQPALAHSYVGAVIARRDYGLDDPEILDAIAHHIFGEVGMNLLDKIINVADFIEPTRFQNDIRKKITQLAYEDIDKAMIAMLEFIEDFNLARKRPIYSKGVKVKEYLNEKTKQA